MLFIVFVDTGFSLSLFTGELHSTPAVKGKESSPFVVHLRPTALLKTVCPEFGRPKSLHTDCRRMEVVPDKRVV